MQVLGVSPSDIAYDYALTEIGLQPAIPYMSARMRKEPIYRDNWKGASNMARARPQTMLSVISQFHYKYGTPEEYLVKCTSLTRDDIDKLKACLLTELDSSDIST